MVRAMARPVLGMAALSLASLAACGGKVVVDEPAASGSGGSASTTVSTSGTLIDSSSSGGPVTSASSTNSGVTVTTDVGTGPSQCDTLAVCQDNDGDPTNDC